MSWLTFDAGMIDAFRAAAVVINGTVGAVAAARAGLLTARGEVLTERWWLIVGITLMFLGQSAWSFWVSYNRGWSGLPLPVDYYVILSAIAGTTLMGGLIHARTFTRAWLSEAGWIALAIVAWATGILVYMDTRG